MADRIQLIILISFATLISVLAQSRELMRQISRTADEWHHMRAAMRGPRRPRKPVTGAPDPDDVITREEPEQTAPGNQ